jgi:Na+/H+ antiporter NhaA
MLLSNGRVHTLDADNRVVDALLIRAGRIAFAGRRADVNLPPGERDRPRRARRPAGARRRLTEAARELRPPGLALERALHPVQAYVVLPLFALANAGVTLTGGGSTLGHPVGLGVVLGLVLGKPAGIRAGAWLAVRTWRGALPAETT